MQSVSVVNPARSNIAVISTLTEFDDEPVLSTDPSNPSVTYDPYMEAVIPLSISIVKATDRTRSSDMQLSILGCADPKPITTKAQVEGGTTLASVTSTPSSAGTKLSNGSSAAVTMATGQSELSTPSKGSPASVTPISGQSTSESKI